MYIKSKIQNILSCISFEANSLLRNSTMRMQKHNCLDYLTFEYRINKLRMRHFARLNWILISDWAIKWNRGKGLNRVNLKVYTFNSYIHKKNISIRHFIRKNFINNIGSLMPIVRPIISQDIHLHVNKIFLSIQITQIFNFTHKSMQNPLH